MWGDVGEYCGENVPIELTATIGVTEAAKLGKAGHCVRGFESAPFANLRRERPTNNSIGHRHVELIVALEARNRLVADLWGESGSGINVNLLLGFTARTFHSHHNVSFACHAESSGLFYHGAQPVSSGAALNQAALFFLVGYDGKS